MDKKIEKTKNEKLMDKIFLKKETSWNNIYKTKHREINSFSKEYKKFLNNSKTERSCVREIVKNLEKFGFKKYQGNKNQLKNFMVIKNKVIIAWKTGKKPENIRLIGSHIDSPRLDLKPYPLYEDNGMALFKTHYYGGIKKYQWVNIPLALLGIVILKNNKKINICVGLDKQDPKFVIPDLLIHLAKEQMNKNGHEIIKGEDLNVLVGHIPVTDKNIKEKVKFCVLKKLHEKYGIIEEDFISAELEFVPAQESVDIGFDSGMIGGYGQDDRSGAFTSLKALTESSNRNDTMVGFFVDKEEIGSTGDCGADSFLLYNFLEQYIEYLKLKQKPGEILNRALSVSADVTAGLNPNFKEVHDLQNAPLLGKGVVISKYGGARGKVGSNDAHAEYVAYVRNVCEKGKIPWQTGELGKIDLGGGGTIAMFLSKFGMNCIDAGPALLGMHSPFEISSKADIFASYQFFKLFFEDSEIPNFK